jgi:leucyl-tRNA synthetase
VVMFPYPSGKGLHIGHYYNYAIVDSICRFKRHQGLEVFQPFGYDAFGLPAENYAREIGGDPRKITYENIARFRQQMQRMDTMYEEKLVTSDPSYYKWTQWIFKKLHEHGLAYKAKGLVNFCPSCDTVLANEQVVNEHCERCGTAIDQQMLEQWYFKITAYKDRLIAGLDKIDYPVATIKKQRHWLESLRDWCVSRQRKWGCPIPIEGETDTLDTFVDSSFYYLRYLTDSDDEFLPQGCYRPVDLYVGGAEHACMHLIYARFIHYFLYDIGVVPQEEPFNKVVHQGIITRNGSKMAKSKGNVVNPDDYDPNVLRLGLMFIGPYFEGGRWAGNNPSVKGAIRCIRRMKSILENVGKDELDVDELEVTIAQHVERFKFNRVVSSFMEFCNKNKNKRPNKASAEALKNLFCCFAPSFTVST